MDKFKYIPQNKIVVKKYGKLIIFIAVVALLVINFTWTTQIFNMVLKVLKPVFMALFFALIFNIPTTFLENKIFRFKKEKFKRPVALICTYTFFLGIMALAFYILVPQLYSSIKALFASLPQYMASANLYLDKLLLHFSVSEEKRLQIIEGIKTAVSEYVGGIAGGLPQAIEVIKLSAGAITNLVFALVLSVFMLSGKEKFCSQLWRFMYSVLPVKVSTTLRNWTKITTTVFSSFLGGQLIEALLLGTMAFIGMLILRLPYALLIATILAFVNVIPLVGAYIGAVLGFLIISFISLKSAIIFLIFVSLLQMTEGNFIYPRVVGRSLGLSGFWVLSAVLICGGLFSFWGIILGVPAVAVIYKILGRRVGKMPEAGMLLSTSLKKPTQKASGYRAYKRCR